MCWTPRPSIPTLGPTFWFSDTDQTDRPNEIYCTRAKPGYGGVLRKVLQLVARGP